MVDALALTSSRSTVRVQAFSFTSKRITKALIDAYDRGADVQVILDQRQNTRKNGDLLLLKSKPNELVVAGIPTFLDPRPEAHNKVMVIGDSTTIIGSFNFSEQAETKNAENLAVICSRAIAKEYSDNWKAEQKRCVRAKQNNAVAKAPPPVSKAK